MPTASKSTVEVARLSMNVRHTEALLNTGALQSAIFNRAHFSSIATDTKGELGTLITPGFEALVFKASRGIGRTAKPIAYQDVSATIVAQPARA